MLGRSVVTNYINIRLIRYLEKCIDYNLIMLIFFKGEFTHNMMRLYTSRPYSDVIHITNPIVTNAVFFYVFDIRMVSYIYIIFYEPLRNTGLDFCIECF